jgi:hypothetical protein
MHRRLTTLACLALALAITGCSSGGGPSLLSLPPPGETSSADDDGDNDTKSPLSAFLVQEGRVVGTPTEVYTRVARGVLTCWFGASGPLKAGYIYHADAEPASKGGRSEIKIMVRDMTADDPRALRAYRVLISPSDSATKVEAENVRMPEVLAKRLATDIDRWSRDEPGCGEGPVTGGWAASEVEAKPPPATKTTKTKTKAK